MESSLWNIYNYFTALDQDDKGIERQLAYFLCEPVLQHVKIY